jgi:hypothetical protein
MAKEEEREALQAQMSQIMAEMEAARAKSQPQPPQASAGPQAFAS